MPDRRFNRDIENDRSFLSRSEKEFADISVPNIPGWIETYHLTLFSIAWILLILLFSFLAKQNINWLWLVSLSIVGHIITDTLDGAVGRYRNTGLVRWGYYMDHFLDYIYLCAIFIGYSFLVPDHSKYLLFFILAIFGAFMVNAFLSTNATGDLKTTFLKIGATEIQIGFMLVNTVIIFFGKTYVEQALPAVLISSLVVLVVFVFQTQTKIWHIDIRNKKNNEKNH